MSGEHLMVLIGLAGTVLYIFAFAMVFDAIMKARTSQGAIAWSISLITFPYLALPLYLIFGRSKFHGYVKARRSDNQDLKPVVDRLSAHCASVQATLKEEYGRFRALEMLGQMPFTHSNSGRLLIDGKATFDAIFEGIESARDYILVQFYIINDDMLGREFKEKLIARSRAGVRVHMLFDEIGCWNLPEEYLLELRSAGIDVRPFQSTQGKTNRFQINFRNHRKIVVIDGLKAFVGGLNVGDEYMGRIKKYGAWRDTHLEVSGPSVQGIQLAFLEDWYWAAHSIPKLNWELRASRNGSQDALVLPTGPADTLETCGLFFLNVIHSAERRLWIASPYFVPDRPIVTALQLAALRGVDVRLLLPEKADSLLVYLSSFSYLEETEQAGVRVYRYQPGFLHHKVVLVDDHLAAVGTANLDNRSFRLNFEITMVFADELFARQVEAMFNRDLDHSRQVHATDLAERGTGFRFAVQVARLLAPIQ